MTARDIDIPDLSPASVGIVDVVLFLGVLYHLKEPLAALERVASVTGGMLVLETLADLTFMRQPAWSPTTGLSFGSNSRKALNKTIRSAA